MMFQKPSWPWALLLCLLFFTPVAEGALQEYEKTVPLPTHELSEELSSWFIDSGFHVHRTALTMGRVQLTLSLGEVGGKITLTPWSALATKVAVAWIDQNALASFDQKLWRHISDYINTPTSEFPLYPGPIPPEVLSKTELTVCVRAESGEITNQFSGVVVDTGGLVLCTAHGLSNAKSLRIRLYDGREVKGTVIHQDPRKDLALLHIPVTTNHAVSLVEGRNLLERGETVFSAGCPATHHGGISVGEITGPPRRVDELPLWQVKMQIHYGNSGSPVFDEKGNLVAMVKGRYRGTTSVGFLIPLETIIQFLKENTLS